MRGAAIICAAGLTATSIGCRVEEAAFADGSTGADATSISTTGAAAGSTGAVASTGVVTSVGTTADGTAGTDTGAPPVECPPAEEPGPLDLQHFLRALHQVDDLPALGTGTSEMVSTWDRSGGLADGWDYSGFEVDGDDVILLSVDGPGCIHRFSTGEAQFLVVGSSLRIAVDGEPVVDVPVQEFFDPELSPFAGPLVSDQHYPTVRMPIPFAEHAEVRLVAPEGNLGNFWQIAYSRYADVAIQSLSWPLDADDQLAFETAGDAWTSALVGEHEPPVGPLSSQSATLAAGESLGWDDRGCGTIDRLEVELGPDDAASWRDTWIRATWDDADEPAVELPLAAFMVGPEYGDDVDADFDSLLAGVTGGRAYLRLPMTYRTAASIEIENAGAGPVDVGLDVYATSCDCQPESFGYLHASMHAAPAGTRTSPVSGPYDVPVHRLLQRASRGKIVGTTLRVDWPYADMWWGEGDWQIWIDQDDSGWPPAYHGTGTEEFYDGGWTQFSRKAVSGIVKPRPGLVTVFGFLLSDAFDFQQSVRMQVETLGLNEAHALILAQNPVWDSTVYWYDEAP